MFDTDTSFDWLSVSNDCVVEDYKLDVNSYGTHTLLFCMNSPTMKISLFKMYLVYCLSLVHNTRNRSICKFICCSTDYPKHEMSILALSLCQWSHPCANISDRVSFRNTEIVQTRIRHLAVGNEFLLITERFQ